MYSLRSFSLLAIFDSTLGEMTDSSTLRLNFLPDFEIPAAESDEPRRSASKRLVECFLFLERGLTSLADVTLSERASNRSSMGFDVKRKRSKASTIFCELERFS